MLTKINISSPDFNSVINDLTSYDSISKPEVIETVSKIISDVKHSGNKALFSYTNKLDNFDINLDNYKATTEEIREAYNNCDTKLIQAFEVIYNRVKSYHERQVPINDKFIDENDITLGWKWSAVDSVSLYVPGGKAFYPSSIFMNAVPAIVSGVKRIAITVPAPDGELNPILLAAARVCGIEEIYKVGGAQAVAAMAYGTETIKAVSKIVGPGNAYVAEAKRQVFGKVGIDMIAGPSEILVIADGHANPKWVAADLLSQAEHDEDARSILVCESEDFANKVSMNLEVLLEKIRKKDTAVESLKNNGYAIIVNSVLRDSPEIVNLIAPEHLEVFTENPEKISKNIHNAGAIFLGSHTPEALGDYVAGPSHVLPTMGTAKFSSGLSVMDFLKRTSMIKCSKKGMDQIGLFASKLAKEEGLDAHAMSINIRNEKLK
jgi:histidinol dehydrogenase